jgi:O-antigen/teichoic acid export membrane protein
VTLTYGTNVAVAGLSLASVLITSRALGADGRGQVAFLTTVAYLTSQLANLGLPQANVNFAGRDPQRSPALAGTSVALAAVLGALAAGAVALLFAIVPAAGGTSPIWLQALVLTSVPMLVVQTCLVHLALAQYLFVVYNTVWLVPPLLNVTANGTLAVFGLLSVAWAVVIWVGGQALATLMLVWVVVRRLGGFGRPRRVLAREMLTFGSKAHLGRVMLVGNYRLDQWILGAVAGPGPLGVYSVAVAWSESLFFLPTAFSSVQRPDLVRATPEQARHQVARSFRHALLLTMILALALIALAPFLCVEIFGEEFRGSIGPLRVLALGAPGIVALKLFGNALTAQRKPLRETAAIGVAFASILILDAVLIPRHEAGGAAIASSIAYTIGGLAAAVAFVTTFSAARQRAANVSVGVCSPSDAAHAEAIPPSNPTP